MHAAPLAADLDLCVGVGFEVVRPGGRARVAEGEERERLWKAMNAEYAGFDAYDERTSRDIAVFVLEPR